jgi:crotonobetainyl-CoA:carnitine CoA-transferase CaiB-like acyl-CoA transferase
MAEWSILELASDSLAISYATALLLRTGATVVKAERQPGGDPLRQRHPMVSTAAGNVSLSFLHTCGGKSFVACDPSRPSADRESLIASASLIISDGTADDIGPIHGSCLILVRPFGATGPHRNWRASSFSLFHAAGLGYVSPRAPQTGASELVPPQAPWGYPIEYLVGSYIAAVAAAILVGRYTGVLEISEQEVLLPLVRREIAAVRYEGQVPSRLSRLWEVGPSGFYETADGVVYASIINDDQWLRFLGLIGRSDQADRPELQTARERFKSAPAVDALLAPWFKARSSREVFELCGRASVPVGPALSAEDLLSAEQLRERHALVRNDAARVSMPAVPVRGMGIAADSATAVDRLGGSVPPAASLVMKDVNPEATVGRTVKGRKLGAPLAGKRVVEFTHVWAGPLCGQLLADLGCEVIRVEHISRIDVHRTGGPWPDGMPGHNRSGVWNAQNRGKYSCSIDLKSPDGQQAALELAASSDIVLENFRPGVLGRLGLGPERIWALNPMTVIVSLSGYGQDGPWSGYPAYGPMMDALGGLCWATQTPAGSPQSINGWLPDVSAAFIGAYAAAVGLGQVQQAGKGHHYDVSQFEATVSLLPEAIGQAQLDQSGEVRANIVPGQSTILAQFNNADSWAAIVIRSESDLLEVARVIADFAASGSAYEGGQTAVIQLTGDRDSLCDRLQRAGVECVPVMSAQDLLGDEHLRARGSFVTLDHAEIGPYLTYRSAVRPLDPRDGWQWANFPAPLLGEHTDLVLGRLMRLNDDAFDAVATPAVTERPAWR